jgi:hypothetical protein
VRRCDWHCRRGVGFFAESKFDHCLNDLLYRYRTGALPIEIPGVVSNHDDLQRVVEWNGIPYNHVPVSKETKPEQEAKILEMLSGCISTWWCSRGICRCCRRRCAAHWVERRLTFITLFCRVSKVPSRIIKPMCVW